MGIRAGNILFFTKQVHGEIEDAWRHRAGPRKLLASGNNFEPAGGCLVLLKDGKRFFTHKSQTPTNNTLRRNIWRNVKMVQNSNFNEWAHNGVHEAAELVTS